jgi:hypothetical protein
MGSNKSAKNIAGISALGLIAAHKLSGQRAYEQSGLLAAQSLRKAFEQGLKKEEAIGGQMTVQKVRQWWPHSEAEQCRLR